jgi:hypothetical protein
MALLLYDDRLLPSLVHIFLLYNYHSQVQQSETELSLVSDSSCIAVRRALSTNEHRIARR